MKFLYFKCNCKIMEKSEDEKDAELIEEVLNEMYDVLIELG